MQKVLLATVFLFVLGLSTEAMGQGPAKKEDGPHYETGTGQNESQARQQAEAAVDAFVNNFELGLDPGDYVVGVRETGTWDAANQVYEIEFTIIWIDIIPMNRHAERDHLSKAEWSLQPLMVARHQRQSLELRMASSRRQMAPA